MKLHDLRPAEGSRKERTRVGRGIAAGKGKTAGRGTKGQKARAGGSIPPWFEGGQTPLHVRIPKLRGFKNRFKLEYEVVNVGAIAAAVERGALEPELPPTAKGTSKADAQITVNQDILRAVGLVRSLSKPLKILGAGELSAPLFVVADAFTGSARAKIEAAGGTVSVLEVPTKSVKAIGLEPAAETPATETPAAAEAATEVAKPRSRSTKKAKAEVAAPAEVEDETAADVAAEPVTADADATADADRPTRPERPTPMTRRPRRTTPNLTIARSSCSNRC